MSQSFGLSKLDRHCTSKLTTVLSDEVLKFTATLFLRFPLNNVKGLWTCFFAVRFAAIVSSFWCQFPFITFHFEIVFKYEELINEVVSARIERIVYVL